MRTLTTSALALLTLAGSALAAAPTPADTSDSSSRHGHSIMNFSTMYGVDGPFIGEKNAIRGVVGDELPWTIDGFVFGELDTRGNLRILVHGLVFADDPSVPPDLIGTNDEAEFRGLVSCLTEVGDTVETQNVITDGFRANTDGDSFIHARIELPNPCVAPIVMILAGSEDKWFAVTGFESEKDGGD